MSEAGRQRVGVGWNALLLPVLWAALYGSFTLLAPPLLDDADSVHAEVAREMLLRHDWVTLYANGIRYLEKAPLYYWAMAASMRLTAPLGLGATAASRLPLALAVLALALLLERFARVAWESARAGLYAGLMVLSSFGFFIFSRINLPDVLVCVWLSVALYAWWRLDRETAPLRRLALACVFAMACALNVLTKGLIGIVFPVGIAGVSLLAADGVRGGWARLRALPLLPATAVFLGLAVPWHVLIARANPGAGHPGGVAWVNGHWSVPLPSDGNVHGWAWFYFVNEQVLRYLNLRVPRDYDTVPLWLFLGLVFVWLMPWSAYLPGALARAIPLRSAGWRRRLRRHGLNEAERLDLLLVVWAVLPLAFFSLSTRQEYYVLPALPAMVLLMARRLVAGKSLQRAQAVLAVLGGASAAVCLVLVARARVPAAGTDLASLLMQNPGDYALSFGHFLDLNVRAMGMFRAPLLLTAAAFGVGLPLAWWMERRQRGHRAVLVTAASAFTFLLAAWLGLRTFAPVLTSAQLAEQMAPELQPGDLIVLHGEYEAGSTLGFYLGRPVDGHGGGALHILEGRSSNLWYGSFFPDAPAIFETRESLAAKWGGPQRIFVWEDPQDAARPVLQLAPRFVVASGAGKYVFSNRRGR